MTLNMGLGESQGSCSQSWSISDARPVYYRDEQPVTTAHLWAVERNRSTEEGVKKAKKVNKELQLRKN